MNETLKTIAKRYSCRSFSDKRVSDEDLRLIMEAAICAPSGMNRQHWQIIVTRNKKLIEAIDAEGMSNLSKMPDTTIYDRMMARGGTLFYNAPCLILIAIKEAYPKGAELIDLGIVAQNISLAATSLGIDNLHCGMTVFAFIGDKANEFKQMLKFPQGYECGMAVLLGYGSTIATPHVPDKSKLTIID